MKNRREWMTNKTSTLKYISNYLININVFQNHSASIHEPEFVKERCLTCKNHVQNYMNDFLSSLNFYQQLLP